MSKIKLVLITVLATGSLIVSSVRSEEAQERPRRIEGNFSFEYLSPHATYGNWITGNVAFYSKQSSDFTYFVQGSFYNRDEGNDLVVAAGAYKDWASFLYTYSAVATGTHSTYLPMIRADHDFNLKIGPSKNIVLTTGITFIDYYNDHRDLIVSGGPSVYVDKWLLRYRLFYNISYPGSVSSFSHLVSIGYGKECWQWTYLDVSFGKQAYLATQLATPEAVDNNSLYINLQHRHWLGKYYGIFGSGSYFKLEDGYEKFGVSLGVFYEF